MKPALRKALDELAMQIAGEEVVLERKRTALLTMRELYGESTDEVLAELPKRTNGAARRIGRATVRRQKAKAARALRTATGRRRELAPGSLEDRIIEVLTEFAAPMKFGPLTDAVKADAAAVKKTMTALRADGRVHMVGQRAGARYAVPGFTHVIVADTED